MFLVMDGCPLQTPARDRGIGRFTSGLMSGLKAVRPGWRIEVVEHSRLPPIPSHRVQGLTVRRFDAPLAYDLQVEANRGVNDRYYADWLLAQRPDHMLFVSIFEKLGVVPRFVGDRPAFSAVMHDLIPILFPEHYGVCQPGEKWFARRLRDIAGTDVLFCNSQLTATESRRLIGPACPPAINVQGAVEDHFIPLTGTALAAATIAIRAKFGITKSVVLYVGGYDYRKNLSGAIAGFAALPAAVRDDLQLVIACFLPDWLREETQRVAERLGLQGQVIFTGYVSDEELLVLYQVSRVFFFPSFYEGLGFPMLEAMRCGAPVVCSNTSALPEFAGDVSRMCDPSDPASMAAALAETLAEPYEDRRADRVAFARSFSWERTAEKVAGAIETTHPTPRPARRRLAWVAASPPATEPEGASDAEFLAAVAPFCDVELVLPTLSVSPAVASQYPVLTPGEVEDRNEAVRYDLFTMLVAPPGPDPFVLALAARHRGLIVLGHPDPARFQAERTWRLLAGAAGIVVWSSAARHWVRTLTDTPVVVIPQANVEALTGKLFAAAAEDAVARLEAIDGKWFDDAANALAAVPVPIPPAVFDDWAALRQRCRETAAPIQKEWQYRASA